MCKALLANVKKLIRINAALIKAIIFDPQGKSNSPISSVNRLSGILYLTVMSEKILVNEIHQIDGLISFPTCLLEPKQQHFIVCFEKFYQTFHAIFIISSLFLPQDQLKLRVKGVIQGFHRHFPFVRVNQSVLKACWWRVLIMSFKWY